MPHTTRSIRFTGCGNNAVKSIWDESTVLRKEIDEGVDETVGGIGEEEEGVGDVGTEY